MEFSKLELLAVTGATPEIADGWWHAFLRYRASKASRCVASSVKSVDWYCFPVIVQAVRNGVSIDKYRASDFEDRQAARKQAGIRNNTLRKEAMTVKAMLATGVHERLIKRNPLANYIMAPKVKPFVATPTPTTFPGLLRAVLDHYRPAKNPGAANISKTKGTFLRNRDVAIIVLLARGAMRPCEVFALRLSDYQPTEGRVVVRIAKDREPRYVPIYHDVTSVIDAYLKVRPAADTDFLFVNDRGGQIKVDWWSKHFKSFATAAGMPDVTPRALRHYGLTQNSMVNLLAASKAAGHSSLATTKGYLHNQWEDTRAALAAVPHIDMSAIQGERSRKRII